MPNGQPPTNHKSSFDAGLQITRGNYHWGPTIGQSTSVTYAFRRSSDAGNATTFQPISAAQQQSIKTALALWADVAGITFNLVQDADSFSNNATILFGSYYSTEDKQGTHASLPNSNNNDSDGDVWLNRDTTGSTAPAVGDRNGMILIHEIGHALGLDHPGDYNAGPGKDIKYENDAQYIEDTNQYTLMSYFEKFNQPETPLLHDIAAIQRLYGANLNTRLGDTTYGFNSSVTGILSDIYNFNINRRPNIVIYDSGGNDTLDLSGWGDDAHISLVPGTFSSAGGQLNNIAMADEARDGRGVITNYDYIENAIGGSGSDVLIGYDAGNRLEGNAGDDKLYGNKGNDTLDGGRGRDTLDGGDGADTASYVDAWSVVNASLATNRAVVGGSAQYGDVDALVRIENLEGSRYGDSLIGDAGANTLLGRDGADLLDGGGGADRLLGGAGADTATYATETAAVTIDLQSNVTFGTARTSTGVDALFEIENVSGSAFNDKIFGNTANNVLVGNAGNDTLNGRDGVDTLIGGVGDDTYSLDDLVRTGSLALWGYDQGCSTLFTGT